MTHFLRDFGVKSFFILRLEKLIFHSSKTKSEIAFPCLGKKIETGIFNFFFLGWQHKMSMSCGIFVY
jgi:hypothetical protein